MTFPAPARASHAPAGPSRPAGIPWANASGTAITNPASSTQANTEAGSIMRLDREEQTVEIVHAAAAPNPPRIAVIMAGLSWWRRGRRPAAADSAPAPPRVPRRALLGGLHQRAPPTRDLHRNPD